METTENIIKSILSYYPDLQAIYLFGSYMTDNEWPDSDIDIALLFAPDVAKKVQHLAMRDCALELAANLGKKIDLLNARTVSTVFQKEIVTKGRVLYSADRYAVDEFEMLTVSFYQKLNEERSGIIESALADGRFYA